jgi:fructokinase
MAQSIAIFGEVLFDTFEDGVRILGGAPFNVAWNLTMLGADAKLISRIGTDSAANEVREAMAAIDMDDIHLQRDSHHPTGRVDITLKAGEPHYTICTDQAYDHIEPPTPPLAADWLYHGTLAARSPVSFSTLQSLMRDHPRRFVDVNFRDPFVDADQLPLLITNATWLKLNHEECDRLCRLYDLPGARALMAHFRAQNLILTRAEAGAEIYTPQSHHQAPAPEVTGFKDSVGAGDGFSAMAIWGVMHSWPPEQILKKALAFAAAICTLNGATTPDCPFYQRFKEQHP